MDQKAIVGITLGDAAGIGPEIVAKILIEDDLLEKCNPLIIGTKGLIEQGMNFAGVSFSINCINRFEEARFKDGVIDVLDLHNLDVNRVILGKVDKKVGKAAVEFTLSALGLAIEGKIHAISSAPVNKVAMNMSGYDFLGQTELLAYYSKAEKYSVVIEVGGFFIYEYSSHISLRNAINAIKCKPVLDKILFVNKSIKEFGYNSPRIAIACINPHCGENGRFGREDIDEILPAVEKAKQLGINIIGPVPPDALFIKAKNNEYDAVIAMYHDQANIAANLIGDAITLVAGLPVIRTSVVHGTAYDIVGKGIANSSMMKKAVLTAAKLGTKKYKL